MQAGALAQLATSAGAGTAGDLLLGFHWVLPIRLN